MCRLFAFSGNTGSPEYRDALMAFAVLADKGCVPCGIEPGHQDGWGIHSSNKAHEVYIRSVEPIDGDSVISSTESVSGDGQVIAHLRKATVGTKAICNTHPFLRSGICFCHNGSIHAFESTVFTNDRHLREGHTDSETFFLRILDRIDGQLGDGSLSMFEKAIKDEVIEIQKISEWTSLTCLLKTKEGIILHYLWNEKDPERETLKLDEYYTFYKGTKDGMTILCSETLDIQGFTWEKLDNGTILTLPNNH
ncbi:class II glutamine amidotransferase [Candidatus Nomurabacteria bacterium]|jgi:predicted glutamine amidotransferase|nr:MAG: class II glutamine amidotransferase [Candidatus Nomurabacteria bacterium]